jgi:nucleotide-binding universal stress UspA family protein
MYDDILLPIDGSEPSLQAAEHAIELATTYDATLHALYVVDSDPSPLAVSRADVRETLREVGEEAGEAAFAKLEPLAEAAGVELVLSMLEGTPEQRIVDYATDTDIDLVVMGTHGRSGLGRRLVGSVTERVVRSAPVPVVTVGNESGD